MWWPNTQGDEWEVHGKHAPSAYDSSVGFQVQHRTRPDPPPPERERASLHAARPQPRMRREPELSAPVRAQACEEITAAKRAEALEILEELGKLEGKLHNAQAPTPPLPGAQPAEEPGTAPGARGRPVAGPDAPRVLALRTKLPVVNAPGLVRYRTTSRA